MPKKPKAISDDLPKCGSCTFIQSNPGEDAGYCRRYPPQVVMSDEGEYSAYPVVEVGDFCGEFKRKVN